MFEEIMGRDRMIGSAERYGKEIRRNVSSNILRLIYKIENEIETLEHVKKTQEQWYPSVGVTTGELEALRNYLEKMVTVFRAES